MYSSAITTLHVHIFFERCIHISARIKLFFTRGVSLTTQGNIEN
jgi:hypothetical protein